MTTEEMRRTLQSDPVAKQLLRSTIPARLAYTWRDGTTRGVPMWFHWTGEEFLIGAPPNAPKMRVLADRPVVAFSVDSDAWPYRVLCVRGIAAVTNAAMPFPEY